MLPVLIAAAAAGLWLATLAHRRSSPLLVVLICAATCLAVSPISWVHHMVWVVPAILWLALAPDRPRWGPCSQRRRPSSSGVRPCGGSRQGRVGYPPRCRATDQRGIRSSSPWRSSCSVRRCSSSGGGPRPPRPTIGCRRHRADPATATDKGRLGQTPAGAGVRCRVVRGLCGLGSNGPTWHPSVIARMVRQGGVIGEDLGDSSPRPLSFGRRWASFRPWDMSTARTRADAPSAPEVPILRYPAATPSPPEERWGPGGGARGASCPGPHPRWLPVGSRLGGNHLRIG